MECFINGCRMKYEDGEVYLWKTKWRDKKLKVPYWYIVKGRIYKYKNDMRKNTCIGGRTTNGGKTYKWHRVIYKLHNPEWNIDDNSKCNIIDHIDGDSLNNNIENLRVVTHQQNQFNTKCKGYSWHKASNKWRVRITLNGKEIYGGLFINEEDAKNKYLELKEKYHKIN